MVWATILSKWGSGTLRDATAFTQGHVSFNHGVCWETQMNDVPSSFNADVDLLCKWHNDSFYEHGLEKRSFYLHQQTALWHWMQTKHARCSRANWWPQHDYSQSRYASVQNWEADHCNNNTLCFWTTRRPNVKQLHCNYVAANCHMQTTVQHTLFKKCVAEMHTYLHEHRARISKTGKAQNGHKYYNDASMTPMPMAGHMRKEKNYVHCIHEPDSDLTRGFNRSLHGGWIHVSHPSMLECLLLQHVVC